MSQSPADTSRIPTVSLVDSLRFTLGHLLPSYLQGLFTRSRFWVTVVSALHPDPLSVKFVSRLRRRYGSEYLFVRVGKTPTLLVLGLDGIRRVLDRSPQVYAEPPPKRRGMSRFMPGAVTISRGIEWRDRRRFNESVLNSCQDLHGYAEEFLRIIRGECDRVTQRAAAELRWSDFDHLFGRITLGILFGRTAVADRYLTRTLRKLMRNGNRSFLPPRRKLFEDFYAALRGYLRWPVPNSLASLCRETAASPATRVENQIPHWMFAMHETLATNTARALGLIAAHPDVQRRVREELSRVDLTQPESVHALRLLEGCLQEAMRLWPTTPMLMRESIEPDVLGGEIIPPKTRVLVLNSFNHRDRESCDTADSFTPDRWLETPVDYRFNHLSNGTQVCAGKNLALFVGTAVLAALLKPRSYKLVKPRLVANQPMPHAFNYFRTRLVSES
jgi:cytochrome P450